MHPSRRLQSGRDHSPLGFDDPADSLFIPDEVRWIKPELRDLFDLDDPDIEYIADSIKYLKIAGLDVEDPNILALAIEGGRRRASIVEDDTGLIRQIRAERDLERKQLNAVVLAKIETRNRVYYARIGNRCKIGYSANVRARMSQIQPEELLVAEPGGAIKEAERHEQFKSLRTRGEWFRYEGALVEHVQALQAAKA